MAHRPLLFRLDRRARLVLLRAVFWYQDYLGWLLGGHCRFFPTCSCYAEEALQRGPLLRALLLIAWRLMRCQPLCRAGNDPVPPGSHDESWWLTADEIARLRK